MDVILTPPIAFLIYLFLAALLSGLGRLWAPHGAQSDEKASTYASGEAEPSYLAAPGYRPFFIVALFFAILHLGVLIVGSSNFAPASIVFLIGLILALLALIAG
jgi:NADH:ubiquinone oxidoreductase subunit 3 (subunit A)